MTKRYKIQVLRVEGALVPLTEHDANQLEDTAINTIFNMTSTKKRSNPHHNMYWAILQRVVKATGKWPTKDHLHDELKWACGYVRMRYNSLTGQHMRTVDSISFDDMSQEEFNNYFDMAMSTLAEGIGYDPLQ